MNVTELKTFRPLITPTSRARRPPLSLFRRPIADARTREIARAAAIEVLG